jgi:hypothetical protein
MNTYIEVIEYETKRVVKRINMTGKTGRQIDKVMDGMEINMNHDQFYTHINKSERKRRCF